MRLYHTLHKKEKHIKEHGLFYIVLVALFPLYIMQLNTLPFAFHGDEANTALGALAILSQKTIIGVGWYDLPLVSFLPHLLGMLLFGNTIIGDRVGSVVFGVAALPLFYALVRAWYTRRIALVAAILLGTSHIWIALSRLGIAYVQAGLILIGVLYFSWKAYKTKKNLYGVCAGVVLGLSLYAYYASRIIPIIIFPAILWIIIFSSKKKHSMQMALVISISALVVMLPQIFYFFHAPASFSSRTSEVFIFSQDISVKNWRNSQYAGLNSWQILQKQVIRAISIQNGDTSGQYGYKGWLFDIGTICLFLVGIVGALKKNRKTFLFLSYWFGLTFIGGVILTIDPIFLPRFVVGLPVFFLFCAIGFDSVIDFLKKYRYLQFVIGFLLLVFIITWNLSTYFINYAKKEESNTLGDKNAYNARAISNFMTTLPMQYTVIFLTAPNLYGDFAPFIFLIPDRRKITILNPEVFSASSPCIPAKLYVVYPQYVEKIENLQKTCPYGKSISVTNGDGVLEYTLFQTPLY